MDSGHSNETEWPKNTLTAFPREQGEAGDTDSLRAIGPTGDPLIERGYRSLDHQHDSLHGY